MVLAILTEKVKVKLGIHVLIILFLSLFGFGCAQPIGTTLLSNPKAPCADDTVSVDCAASSSTDSSQLDIQPRSNTLALNVESSDTIEITGSCIDLNRKNNRILVEVFAGEDETTPPFISNAEGNNCLDSTSATQSGLTSASGTCFWVTQGAGLIEDAGLPSQKNYPQCYNGQFGFRVRLGRILVNSNVGQPNLKYLIRMKLRTQDGTIADTAWSRVLVDRGLTTPLISSATYDATTFKCKIKSTPARFNFGILYTLTRTYTDILQTAVGTTNLYTGLNTSLITTGASVFDWDNYGLAEGVTYNYTLTSTDNNYVYTTAPSSASVAVSCETPVPTIAVPPQPSANTCYMSLGSAANPYWGSAATSINYEWAYSTTASWIGVGSNANSGYTLATCGNTTACTQAGLAGATTYYFAVRAIGANGAGEKGKWSPLMSCRTP